MVYLCSFFKMYNLRRSYVKPFSKWQTTNAISRLTRLLTFGSFRLLLKTMHRSIGLQHNLHCDSISKMQPITSYSIRQCQAIAFTYHILFEPWIECERKKKFTNAFTHYVVAVGCSYQHFQHYENA